MGLGAQVALHTKAVEFINEVGPKFFRILGMTMPDIPVDIYLEEGDLEIGGRTFEVIWTPGHSPGGICLYWPEKKALFTGDLVFEGSIGRVDLPGGDLNAMGESIEKIRGLDVEVLLPGHGNIVHGKDRIQQNYDMIRSLFF